MNPVLFFCVVAQVLCLVMLIRNHLVYRYLGRAIDTIYSYQMNMIENNPEKYTSDVWKLLNKPSQGAMLFMITCWTYKSFFGNLEQRMKEITDAVAE